MEYMSQLHHFRKHHLTRQTETALFRYARQTRHGFFLANLIKSSITTDDNIS
jgi:hypothetical protein